MGIYKRSNEGANSSNALQITDNDKMCCDSEVEVHDYSNVLDTGEDHNAIMSKIILDGKSYDFSQEYDSTIEANADKIEQEIIDILESLGYIIKGDFVVYREDEFLIISAKDSQAVFGAIGTTGAYTSFTKFKPNIVEVNFTEFLNLGDIAIPAPGLTLTVEEFSVNGVVQSDQVGKAELFAGGGITYYQDFLNWLNTIVNGTEIQFYYTPLGFGLRFNSYRGQVPASLDDRRPFVISIRRSDDDTLHSLSFDDSGTFLYEEDAVLQSVTYNLTAELQVVLAI